MSTITRTWLAMAAIGAGLIHMALGAGAPLPLAVLFVAIALAELAWGVAAVVRDRVPFATAALIGSLVPIVAWALLIAVASVSAAPGLLTALPFLPMGAATLMGLYLAGTLAVDFRRRKARTTASVTAAVTPSDLSNPGSATSTPSADAAPAAPSTGRYLTGVLVGALLVSGLTTPALANTTAGEYAVPHGEHSGH